MMIEKTTTVVLVSQIILEFLFISKQKEQMRAINGLLCQLIIDYVLFYELLFSSTYHVWEVHMCAHRYPTPYC